MELASIYRGGVNGAGKTGFPIDDFDTLTSLVPPRSRVRNFAVRFKLIDDIHPQWRSSVLAFPLKVVARNCSWNAVSYKKTFIKMFDLNFCRSFWMRSRILNELGWIVYWWRSMGRAQSIHAVTSLFPPSSRISWFSGWTVYRPLLHISFLFLYAIPFRHILRHILIQSERYAVERWLIYVVPSGMTTTANGG